jgi:hypothetical protein
LKSRYSKNGDSRVHLTGVLILGWFIGLVVQAQEIFVPSWLPSSRSSTFFSSLATFSLDLSPSPSKLGRQSCCVTCLLISVSGGGKGGAESVWVIFKNSFYDCSTAELWNQLFDKCSQNNKCPCCKVRPQENTLVYFTSGRSNCLTRTSDYYFNNILVLQ